MTEIIQRECNALGPISIGQAAVLYDPTAYNIFTQAYKKACGPEKLEKNAKKIIFFPWTS